MKKILAVFVLVQLAVQCAAAVPRERPDEADRPVTLLIHGDPVIAPDGSLAILVTVPRRPDAIRAFVGDREVRAVLRPDPLGEGDPAEPALPHPERLAPR